MLSRNYTLKIYNVQPRDFGTYVCQSKNSLGSTESTIKLYEIHVPTEPNVLSTPLSNLDFVPTRHLGADENDDSKKKFLYNTRQHQNRRKGVPQTTIVHDSNNKNDDLSIWSSAAVSSTLTNPLLLAAC